MSIKAIILGLLHDSGAVAPVARYALEPVSDSVDLKNTTANPLAMRGLFIS